MTSFPVDEKILEGQLRSLAAWPWLPEELLKIAGGALLLQSKALAGLSSPELEGLPLAQSGDHALGEPVLPAGDFPVNFVPARRLWDELSALLAELGGNPAEAVLELEKALTADGGIPAESFAAFLRDDSVFFSSWGKRLPQATALVHFLAQASLTPQLAAVAGKLAPGHKVGQVWEHGHCPYCGRLPFMGELTGKEGQRRHVCSFCGSRYRVARLQCPFCLERDTEKLRMFTTDALPFFEVQICQGCGCYIKLADLRQAGAPLPAGLNDLASLPLDMLAQREGYARPTPSAWGF